LILKPIADKLRQLFRSRVRSQGEEVIETAKRLEDRVLTLVDNMPTLPHTATRAMALANDPNSRFADLARLIEGDTTIATGLLRVANSALYRSSCPAVKLEQALVRLGLWYCKHLILSIGMKSLFQRMAGGVQAQCEVLWHHGYVTAHLCRQLNRAYRLGFDGEEFSAGLLHDLGRILLVLADSACALRAGALDFDEPVDRLERERTAIGIDHCALGGWFGEHSGLPGALIHGMRHHHEPNATEHAGRLVILLATADHLANHAQRGDSDTAYNLDENAGLACLWAGWPDARKERFLGDLAGMMEEAIRAADSEQAAA
jgi:HD-like signal output (HDOD) protein